MTIEFVTMKNRLASSDQSTDVPVALQKTLSTFASAELPIMTYGMLADSYLGAVFEAHVVRALLRKVILVVRALVILSSK